ncbi:hypothetical protein QF030_000580 [Streptomyces rishiriensis]|uniref:Uncharacterized protein n=1 Tax=Streptomyces rishiriensis TaxID=68264 RepID=A0ABU0NH19_STRRH|nr:hypothetical protein [Streptomyces rishiriensis]
MCFRGFLTSGGHQIVPSRKSAGIRPVALGECAVHENMVDVCPAQDLQQARRLVGQVPDDGVTYAWAVPAETRKPAAS